MTTNGKNGNVWKWISGCLIMLILGVGGTLLAIEGHMSKKIQLESPYLKDRSVVINMMLDVNEIKKIVTNLQIGQAELKTTVQSLVEKRK